MEIVGTFLSTTALRPRPTRQLSYNGIATVYSKHLVTHGDVEGLLYIRKDMGVLDFLSRFHPAVGPHSGPIFQAP
jgi:hypothetical protein